MSEDIKVTDGTILESLNGKVDLDGGNYIGSGLDKIIHEHCAGTGLQLFDTILKDHVLTYEESKGLALQGTYVYKEAIAGSRYGYPDFYNKVVEEFEGAAIIASPNKIDYTLQDGVLTIKAGTVLKFPDGFESDGVTKKYKYKKLDNDVEYAIKTTLNGGSYYFSMYENSSQTLRQTLWANATTDTTATSGIIYDESQNLCYIASSGVQTALPLFKLNLPATDSSSVALVTSIAQIYQGNSFLEETPTFAPYAPIYQNTNGHLFYDIADKPVIDELFSSTGMAWLYGVDTTEERVFLPRNNWFEQLTIDEAEIGQSVEAGLPNILGKLEGGISTSKLTGAFYSGGGVSGTAAIGGAETDGRAYFDASRSNPIYGNSETVQINAVKKLLYICVGNITSYEGVTEVVNQGMEILEQVNLGLETKVNIDVSNISQEGKENLVSWGIPDYSAMVNIAISNGQKLTWTAPVNCYVYLQTQSSSSCTAVIFTGGTTTPIDRQDNTNSNGKICSASAYVAKGQEIVLQPVGTVNACYYAPLKGVN